MQHITVGKKYNEGKVAFVECVKDASLDNINIKDKCFLLIILTKGKLEFKVNGEKISATAPSFLCFDESDDPVFVSKSKAHYTCVYFHPKFLNINMTFELLRSNEYGDIATTHDMFMLKPFIDKAYVLPIVDTQVEKIEQSAACMMHELTEQRDWYWSCRGRSYFMEIIIALERMYGLIGYGLTHPKPDKSPIISNPKLRDAVLYIEGHYGENITLSDISANARINHTTLTALMKQELGCTAIEYLMNYRITVSKKQLAFTDVPIKDITNMVGFKTVQHFNRIFKEHTGTTPAEFRKSSVKNRKHELNGK
ncbi:MAG: helix-turn-helix transcriptional regulator [Clostridia bacterium]|nr:helix-turn-helix transcriptional regulator [Clostridia bacterium]